MPEGIGTLVRGSSSSSAKADDPVSPDSKGRRFHHNRRLRLLDCPLSPAMTALEML
jgi:hypothetical protein